MNKKIKKIISAALWGAMLSTPTLQAGIGIGTSSPHASAALDITATDRGLLPPRLALTGTTDTTTITSPAEGLIVYNTATISDVTPGIYLWDGVKWTALKAESDTTETVTPADPTTGVVVGLCPAANGLPITTVDSSTEFGGAQTYIPNTVLDGTPKLILLTGTGGSEAALFADNITMSGSGNITRRWDLPAPSAHTGEYYFVAPFPYSNITFPANFQTTLLLIRLCRRRVCRHNRRHRYDQAGYSLSSVDFRPSPHSGKFTDVQPNT